MIALAATPYQKVGSNTVDHRRVLAGIGTIEVHRVQALPMTRIRDLVRNVR